MMKKVSLALLMGDKVSKSCVEYSRNLASIQRSLITLSESNLPHVTIIQTEATDDELPDIWKGVSSIVDSTFQLDFAGLTFIPSSSGMVWVEIQVLKSKSILALQESILQMNWLSGREIFNGTDDKFRPHVTVALFDQALAAPVPLPSMPLRTSKVEARLSFGLVGEHYTFIEPLYMI